MSKTSYLHVFHAALTKQIRQISKLKVTLDCRLFHKRKAPDPIKRYLHFQNAAVWLALFKLNGGVR